MSVTAALAFAALAFAPADGALPDAGIVLAQA